MRKTVLTALAVIVLACVTFEPAGALIQRVAICDGGIVLNGWVGPSRVGEVNVSAGCTNTFADIPDRDGAPHGGPGHVGGGGGFAGNRGDSSSSSSLQDPNQKTPCDREGNPVVFSTGNKIEIEEDFRVEGEMPLNLVRTYNSYWDGIGLFGRRWLSGYDHKLLLSTDDPKSKCYPRPGNTPCPPIETAIWAQRPDGRKIKFYYRRTPAEGWYENKAASIARIVAVANGYVLHSEDNTIETYDTHGFPITIVNSRGIGWTFSYGTDHYLQRITHTSGRHVDFTWAYGSLVQVTDPAGQSHTYTYIRFPFDTGNATFAAQPRLPPRPDPLDPPVDPVKPPNHIMVSLLTGSEQPGSPPLRRTYHYETRFPTTLTGISINGQRYSWFAYDDLRRAVVSRHANGADQYGFSYQAGSDGQISRVITTNPLGKQTIRQLESGNVVIEEGVASANCPRSIKGRSYDANGYLSEEIDAMGHATTYTHSPNGQLTQMIEAYGTPLARTTTYEWDIENNRVLKVTLLGQTETRYTYAADGRIASETVRNLSDAVPDSRGRERTTTYSRSFHPNGMVAAQIVDGPLPGPGDATTHAWSAQGNLLSVTNGLGHVTQYQAHNAMGKPGVIISPNGDRFEYAYDARGRILQAKTFRDGGEQSTQYEYDGFGRMSRIATSDGWSHSYQYDVAGRLLSEFEPEPSGTFAQIVYTYNAMSLRTSATTQRTTYEPARGTVY